MSKSYRRESPQRERRRSPSYSSSRRRSLSRSPSPRRDDELPTSFGRSEDRRVEDDMSALTKMKKGFKGSPLNCLTRCLNTNRKIKVWTRNFKEVRGICTGYVSAFDKHWNLVMNDVDEVYLRPVKGKTPYMDDVDKNLPDLPKKVPKVKKTAAATADEAPAAEDSPEITVIEPEIKVEKVKVEKEEGEKKKKEGEKKKRRKKKKSRSDKRHLNKLFIRGDQIVMISVLDSDDEN